PTHRAGRRGGAPVGPADRGEDRPFRDRDQYRRRRYRPGDDAAAAFGGRPHQGAHAARAEREALLRHTERIARRWATEPQVPLRRGSAKLCARAGEGRARGAAARAGRERRRGDEEVRVPSWFVRGGGDL